MIYKIGGAVRDKLLGKEPHDIDYVVVGSTPDEMLSLGYKQVGTDFPVFLHPETGEEYALARKEISTGDGYGDFKFDFNPKISLEEDCLRRDFTINQICEDENGQIIDYFNGVKDLRHRMIRHICAKHFVEDPVRLLRCARFAAKLDGFTIAEDTIRLCQSMVHKGMLNALTPERVWGEIEKALSSNHFNDFIHSLDVMDALEVILPEVAALKGVPENVEYHPEGNAYKHTLLTLKEVTNHKLSEQDRAYVNFALMCHDLGKALTDKAKWPAHHGHDDLGLSVIDCLCDRLKVPNDFRNYAKTFCKHHMKLYNFLDQHTKTQYDLIDTLTKFKDNHTLNIVQICHSCDKLGRAGMTNPERVELMLRVFNRMNLIYLILKDIGLKDLPVETQENLARFKGEKFGKLYRDAKISYLKRKLNEVRGN